MILITDQPHRGRQYGRTRHGEPIDDDLFYLDAGRCSDPCDGRSDRLTKRRGHHSPAFVLDFGEMSGTCGSVFFSQTNGSSRMNQGLQEQHGDGNKAGFRGDRHASDQADGGDRVDGRVESGIGLALDEVITAAAAWAW